MNQAERSSSKGTKSKPPAAARPETFIEELGSKDDAARARARDVIIAMGESAADPLIRALVIQDSRISREAGKLLEEIKVNWEKHADADTINSLVAALGSKDSLVRVRARRVLAAIGKKSVAAL